MGRTMDPEGTQSKRAQPDDEEAGPPKNLPVPSVDEESDDDAEAGPMLPPKPKKRKVLEHQQLYLKNLPSASMYEKSFMHIGEVTHVRFTRTGFLITASNDGHVKFWKKKPKGEIEFVKRFYAHLGPVSSVAATEDGLWLATASAKDNVVNVFDVLNFDMVNRIQLEVSPTCVEFAHKRSSSKVLLAVGVLEDAAVRVLEAKSPSAAPLYTHSTIHRAPVTVLRYHPQLECILSADEKGLLEYWDPDTGKPPAGVSFKFKSETDLYELAKNKTHAFALDVSPDGELFACPCADHKIRVWRAGSGKLHKTFDESIAATQATQAEGGEVLRLESLELGRRLAVERELHKDLAPPWHEKARPNCVFDASSKLLLFASLVGIKVVSLVENRVLRVLGKPETADRFLALSLLRGSGSKMQGAGEGEADPTLAAASYSKNRFFLFTQREPDHGGGSEGGSGRDALNEKPPKDMALTSVAQTTKKQLGRGAVLHTTMGDMTVRLFPDECPKTVENFCTHASNGYFNGILFHRIIKNFMIQTGDPLGDGTGGTSIWGREFEDEFHRSLRHDRPFILSMANAGPNTNGSQFFITTVPTPWLDNKHTVFGRVVKGMDVVQMLENAKTDKEDKPFDDISIINVRVLQQLPSAKD